MLFYALLTCLFDALVVEAFPERIGAAAGWQGATSFGVVLMLMSGLLLRSLCIPISPARYLAKGWHIGAGKYLGTMAVGQPGVHLLGDHLGCHPAFGAFTF